MPKIHPLPDMTKEEAMALEWFQEIKSDDMSHRYGKILMRYIERHRADLPPSPIDEDTNNSGLLLAAKSALEFIQSIDGYERSVVAVNLRREIDSAIGHGAEKKYNTADLIHNLENAYANGYTELGETDIQVLFQITDDEKRNDAPTE